MWSQLALSFQHGDRYIYIMLALAFVGVVLIFERLVMLQFVYHIDFKKFLDNLRKMVLAEDLPRAISFCKKISSSSLPRVSVKALEAAESDPSRVRGIIEEETLDLLPKIEARITAIPAVATVVFLIGILGTIDSLWITFNSVDILDTAKKQATAAQGVAASLNYTAMGLLVCMVLLFGHQIVRGIALRLTHQLQHGTAVLTNLVAPQGVTYTASMAAMPVATNTATEQYTSNEEFVADTHAPVEQVSAAAPAENFNDTTVDDIKDEEEII